MELKALHEKCSGCGTCKLACALENHRIVSPAFAVLRIEGRFPTPGDYRIHLCDQCGQCADACPEEAIGVDDSGACRIESAVCTGCMLCVEACPQEVMMVHRQVAFPMKCTLCGACVEACPRDAIAIV